MREAQKSLAGYLVVIVGGNFDIPVPANYRGVYRTPAYYFPQDNPYPEEAEGMEAYTFGNYVDLQPYNIIPNIQKATALLGKFKSSRRKFEIVYLAAEDSQPPPTSLSCVELGYDVAVCGGEWYSIVAHFPQSTAEFQVPADILEFRKQLNRYGLFSERQMADDYLKKYLEHKMHDWEMSPWGVVKVWAINSSQVG